MPGCKPGDLAMTIPPCMSEACGHFVKVERLAVWNDFARMNYFGHIPDCPLWYVTGDVPVMSYFGRIRFQHEGLLRDDTLKPIRPEGDPVSDEEVRELYDSTPTKAPVETV